MRYKDLLHKSEKNTFFNRLYNYNFIKFENINNLSQKFLLEESKDYPYFPKINNFSFVMKYYNNNNQSFFSNKNERIPVNSKIKNRKVKIRLLKMNDEEKNHMKDKKINNYSMNYKTKIPIPTNRKNNSNYQKTYKNVEFKFDKITKIVNKKLINDLMKKSSILQNINFHKKSKTPKSRKKIYLYKNISSILNEFSRNKNSILENSIPKSMHDEHLSNNNIFIPRNESSLFFEGIKKPSIKSIINHPIYKNKFNYIALKNKRKIDSTYKQNSLSTYNNSICQNEQFEQYSYSNRIKNINVNYLLFPSKTNSINLTIENLEKEKNNKNKEKQQDDKRVVLKKLSNVELKKYKIFNKIKLKKKLKSPSLSKNKTFNNTYIIDNKINLDNNNKNIKIKNDNNDRNIDLLNDSHQRKETGTTMQTMTDEKMMNIAINYLDKDEMVNKNLIDDILSYKRNK